MPETNQLTNNVTLQTVSFNMISLVGRPSVAQSCTTGSSFADPASCEGTDQLENRNGTDHPPQALALGTSHGRMILW